MTDTDTKRALLRAVSGDTALQGVAVARDWVMAAKLTRSRALIASAGHDLQVAVDRAREFDVPWGQIGLTLGIARGNAYQRYRKKHSDDGVAEGDGQLSRSA